MSQENKKPHDTLNAAMEIGRQKTAELARTIHRVADGDTYELVRAVVEHVTEDMMMSAMNDLNESAIEALSEAKFRAFEEIMGRKFTTTTNRTLSMRREIRDAK